MGVWENGVLCGFALSSAWTSVGYNKEFFGSVCQQSLGKISRLRELAIVKDSVEMPELELRSCWPWLDTVFLFRRSVI